ncbi:MAG: hypothetical protein J0H82_04330 [Alphaproteobacteria bacterium]|nr:hypothetical protein [Alphaproteobacteria bacterium]
MSRPDRVEVVPRGLAEDAAAAYVGVSPPLFRQAVKDGLMPPPIQLGRRRLIWDRSAIDDAFDRIGGRRPDIADQAARRKAERQQRDEEALDLALARRFNR